MVKSPEPSSPRSTAYPRLLFNRNQICSCHVVDITIPYTLQNLDAAYQRKIEMYNLVGNA